MLMMDIFEDHLSEACFRWGQWEQALRAPHYNLEETAEREERLLAHLDALVAGGAPVAEALLKPALEGEAPDEAFTAAFASLAGSPPAALEALVALAPSAPPPVQEAWRRALELSECQGLEAELLSLLEAPEATSQALALQVLAFRQAVPRDVALGLLGHEDAQVVSAALQSLGALTYSEAHRALPRLLDDKRPPVRLAALESGLRSGLRSAWEVCRHEARASREAQVLLASCGDERDAARLVALLEQESSRANALWALGFTGHPSAARACLEFMRQPLPLARLAGEAFCAITGLVLESPLALAPPEQDALPPLEEDDLEADLRPKPEDSLPIPAPAAVEAWWQRAHQDFTRGVRYLDGKPFSGTVLLEVLAHGPMRRRHVHARELDLRTHGAHSVQTLAFTARQRAQLARASRARDGLPTGPLARTLHG